MRSHAIDKEDTKTWHRNTPMPNPPPSIFICPTLSFSASKYPRKCTNKRMLCKLMACICNVMASNSLMFCYPDMLWLMRLTVHWGTRTMTSAYSSQGRVGLGKLVSREMHTVFQPNKCMTQGIWLVVFALFDSVMQMSSAQIRKIERDEFRPPGSDNENNKISCNMF